MSATTDYLVKIPKNQHAELFEQALNSSSKMSMKIFGSEDVIHVVIRPSADNHIFAIQFKGDTFGPNDLVTFKLEVNLQIYFFKAKGIENTKSVIFDKSTEIYELIRRKETRYKLPADWSQACVLTNPANKNTRATAEIIEISSSGMMVALPPEAPRFEAEQKIKLQFTIYRRAQVVLTATIKHSQKKVNGSTTVGLQFDDLSPLIQSKIQNILEDLTFYYAHRA